MNFFAQNGLKYRILNFLPFLVNHPVYHIYHIFIILYNCSVNYSSPEEAKWGVQEQNGTWTGMIGKLSRGEVDLAVNGFFMTSQRLQVIDYTLPFLYTTYDAQIVLTALNLCTMLQVLRVHQGARRAQLGVGQLPGAFSSRLWLAVLLAIVGLALYLTLLYHCGRRYGNQEAEGPPHYELYDSLLYMFGVFCSQGHDLSPRSYSCRLVYLIANLIAVVLLAAYSGTLISFLTVHHNKLPFTDLSGLLADPSYSFGLFNIPDEWYQINDSSSILSKAYKISQDRGSPETPMTALEGLRRVCSIKYAFLLPRDTALALANDINCSLAALPHASFKASLSLGLQKNSPYRSLLTHKLHEMRDSGIVHRLRQSEWAPQLAEEQAWRRVGLDEATPIFAVLLVGVVAASLMLVLERRFSPFCYHPLTSHSNAASLRNQNSLNHNPSGREESPQKGLPFLK
ncbi:hypothetical protein ANN_12302 [Periplaneta americana]|uniref:Ionotropic receptor n=1 Tax=Periplaneta americana TaxID=6978 RepID=A0ABQ8TIW2_PERAM|nr:hypothetical protein ANN_12302 [Periplaneta americana]